MKKHKIKLFSLIALFSVSSSFAQQLYTNGHADLFSISIENGTDFYFHFYGYGTSNGSAVIDGNTFPNNTKFDPADIITVVPETALVSPGVNLPAAGITPSDSIWRLSQNNISGEPFLGVNTELLNPADWTGDITFTLISVTSPSGSGTFSLWQAVQGTLNFYFSSAGASLTVNGNNTLTFPIGPGQHDHYNWGFTEPGTWTITVKAEGTHNSLGNLESTQTFTFEVESGPVIPTMTEWGIMFLIVAILFVATRQLRLSTVGRAV